MRFSWDSSAAKVNEYGSSNFLPEIERQLEGHDWTDLPAKVSVGDNPDKTWTVFLPPGVDLSIWIANEKAFWVDFLIYMESEYLDGDEENYRANVAWLEGALYGGA
ncbi:hypothetical protein KIP68_09265 [Corynebacterium aquatimens]|uniref:Uncharacterized protein n=1 Tax=Corynebacterium aquatimens TaxID=1190508 RepID=A0A931DTU9_9CORY|nr:hypothetical protein [Corynebacterium aquatimens]MBG6121344.1 hypothetical protein [Corynebacterium aquatimens]WJY66109.1 hypothetical protein CAQUA_07055 [Corynebacterium aquatimens]